MDLVEKLKAGQPCSDTGYACNAAARLAIAGCTCAEAAAEIERLRANNAKPLEAAAQMRDGLADASRKLRAICSGEGCPPELSHVPYVALSAVSDWLMAQS